jgi:hypothetical protein
MVFIKKAEIMLPADTGKKRKYNWLARRKLYPSLYVRGSIFTNKYST